LRLCRVYALEGNWYPMWLAPRCLHRKLARLTLIVFRTTVIRAPGNAAKTGHKYWQKHAEETDPLRVRCLDDEIEWR